MTRQLTAIIEREDDGDVALCPDLHVAIQGTTVLEARDNLKEALGSYPQTASDSEIKERLNEEVYGTRMEVEINQGQTPNGDQGD